MTSPTGRSGAGRRTGRRPGDANTREVIRAAAAARFGSQGFQATTVRAVAADAGVDPALVMHYFGSKRGLFHAVIELPVDPGQSLSDVLGDGLDDLGYRMARSLFAEIDALGASNPMLTLLRSAMGDDQDARTLRDYIRTTILDQISGVAAVDHRQLRAELCASQMVGAITARQILEFPELRSSETDALARIYGATLQRYLFDPLL